MDSEHTPTQPHLDAALRLAVEMLGWSLVGVACGLVCAAALGWCRVMYWPEVEVSW